MLPPITKKLTVAWDQAHAFRRFTEQIGTWWPLRTHSVGQARAETVVFEGRVGGRIIEKIRGGEESVWGTVTVWDPPGRIVFTWHPGDAPDKATEVEVRFESVPGGTQLVLVHSKWEALGVLASTARRGYPIGWTYVLAQWADRRWSPVVVAIAILQKVMMPIAGKLAERKLRKAAAQEAGARA